MAVKKKSARKTPARKTASRRAPAKKSSSKAKSKSKTKPKPKKVPPIPKGMHSVTPGLVFKDANAALAFYRTAFGAKELYRLVEPAGRVGHAEMMIGDSLVMMSDEYPEIGIMSAEHYEGSPVRLSIVVKNPDAAFKRALDAGAVETRPLQNEFYGWRSGIVRDPFGYHWFITSQVEVVSPKQMQKRWNKMLASMSPGNAGQDADGG
jgi:PhnB protein